MMRLPIQVRYNDFDERGHVNNAVYLTYFEIGRAALWQGLGGDATVGFILAQATVNYRSPARLGDQLVLEIALGDVRTKSWIWRYRVLDARDDRVVADGETVQVAYDYRAQRSVAVTDELRRRLGGDAVPDAY
jgi:acyl-CoA thioester hydrolase